MNPSPFAPVQTNTALYRQLKESGHDFGSLERAQEAYRICRFLMNGRYRRNERVFISHCVGAASSMAHFDGRIDFILAAMLHASYDSGMFSDSLYGPTPSHRRWLAERVGNEVEQMVFDYNQFSFEKGEPEQMLEKGIGEDQKDLLLIALVHEVDDIADGGLFFSPKYGPNLESRASACCRLSNMIGHERLEETFSQWATRLGDYEWVGELAATVKPMGTRIIPRWRSYLRLRRMARRGEQVEFF